MMLMSCPTLMKRPRSLMMAASIRRAFRWCLASVSRSMALGAAKPPRDRQAEVRQRDLRGHEVGGEEAGAAGHMASCPGGGYRRRRPALRGNLRGTMSDERGREQEAASARAQRRRRPRPSTRTTPTGARASDRSGITDFVRRARLGRRRARPAARRTTSCASPPARCGAGSSTSTSTRSWPRRSRRWSIEVKTEIRFRPTEDGKLVPETTNDVKSSRRRSECHVRLRRRRATTRPARRSDADSATGAQSRVDDGAVEHGGRSAL